jgi:hypothetical protein
MRRTLTAFVFVVASAMIVAAQQGQSGKEPAKPGAAPAPARPATPTDRPSSLRGCISAAPDTNGSFTLTEQGPKGSRFRITGRSMRDFAGKLVEVALVETKGLTIKGGLWPSPNVAAQAGAIDSSRAAIASQPGANASKPDLPLPEVRVNRVRTLEGSCQP